MNRDPECASRIRESEAIHLNIGDTLRKYFHPLSAACIAGVRANTRARVMPRGTGLISRGILPPKSWSYRRSVLPRATRIIALYCQQERTLDPLFIVDGGFQLALTADGISDGIWNCARRFSSTRNISYRIMVKRKAICRLEKYHEHFITRNISSEFRARKLSSLRRSTNLVFRRRFFGHDLAPRFVSLNEFGIYSNFSVRTCLCP